MWPEYQERDMIALSLPREFVGQLQDGLSTLIEQWEYTERYFETGLVEDHIFSRECRNACEAASIAKYFKLINQSITNQVERSS